MNFIRSDITTFIEVIRAGGVSRAATSLGVTQPSVSKAVKRLEEEVGVVLLDRAGHGARLTGPGQIFLETAKRFEAQHVELVRTAGELRARQSGLLRIGLTSPAADSIAVKTISEMVRRRPGLRFQLTIGKSDALNAAVEEGILDLAIVPSYDGESLSCARIDISEDHALVAVRAGHPLARRVNLAIEDLAPYPWVMPSAQSAARRYLVKIFERSGAPAPHIGIEAEYVSEAIMGVILQTDLLALVPGSVLRSWLGRIQPLAIPALDVRRTQVLLSHPQATWTPLMTYFRDLVIDYSRKATA